MNMGGPPPPPPPPGPPPPSAGAPQPPLPPPLPMGGGSHGDEPPAQTGLAAMIAGAKLRRVQRVRHPVIFAALMFWPVFWKQPEHGYLQWTQQKYVKSLLFVNNMRCWTLLSLRTALQAAKTMPIEQAEEAEDWWRRWTLCWHEGQSNKLTKTVLICVLKPLWSDCVSSMHVII